MQAAPALPRPVDHRAQRGILEEAAVADRPIDPGQPLIYTPPRTDRQMPPFAVALLARRQSPCFTARRQQSVWPSLRQRVHLRRARRCYGVAERIGVVSPTVEHQEE